ncbi:MAG: class I SAM-dependent methyltransferase, partial [Candidatus Brocadiia bacterium]
DCGPGHIPLRLARELPDVRIDAVDGAAAMLEHARSALAAAPDCAERVRFIQATLPHHGLASGAYHAIVSNSLLHHLHDPSALWDTVKRLAAPGARVLVMDLSRPADPAAAESIVATYAAGEPEVLRRDFYNSLFAAFTPDEVRSQLQQAGLGGLDVTTVSDRHLLVQGQLP